MICLQVKKSWQVRETVINCLNYITVYDLKFLNRR